MEAYKMALRALLAENEQLHEANADLKREISNTGAQPAILGEQIGMLAEKAEWFEATLKEIANGLHIHRGCDPCPMDCPVSIAKEALGRK